jgi:cytochrome c553
VKKILCYLALSALSALGETGDGSGAPLRIYTDFQRDPARAVESSMQRELASLVSPIGLRVDWRSLAEPRNGEASAALVVVTFLGQCNAAGLQPRHVVPGALAWTHISDGVILPFIDVDCDRIRDLMQAKVLQTDAKLREQFFGRAVARVLGHELYHVFTETTHHAKEGVAQAAFTAGDLLSDDFDFGEKEFRTLKTGKLRALLPFRKKALPQSGRAEYAAYGCGACHGAAGQGTHWAPKITGAAKTLTVHFARRREDMYRRARNLKLDWQFPSDEEIADIVSALSFE